MKQRNPKYPHSGLQVPVNVLSRPTTSKGPRNRIWSRGLWRVRCFQKIRHGFEFRSGVWTKNSSLTVTEFLGPNTQDRQPPHNPSGPKAPNRESLNIGEDWVSNGKIFPKPRISPSGLVGLKARLPLWTAPPPSTMGLA